MIARCRFIVEWIEWTSEKLETQFSVFRNYPDSPI
jgi:hypothetical protein